MVDFVHAKKLECGEIDDDEMEQDEVQIIDTSIKVEEDKGEQPIAVTSTKAQTDLALEKSDIIIVLLVHDDVDREPQVKVSL